ncbi:phosphate-import permease protein PhnE [bacterium BMS3Abin02]|nr:phosphate-import permease protein PhnE [bacterium BMS3Abin02]GBE22178.1 phosphate-import permease protein PhnE [bacterium BMS3Bbin01]
MADKEPTKRGLRHSLLVALIIIAGVVIYAYGFGVTKVNLSEIKSETRRAQLTRVLRALARPDLLTYERIDTNTDIPFYMPCPPGGFTPPEQDPYSRHITVDPPCVQPGDDITVRGVNFSPNARVTLYLVPPSGDLNLTLGQKILADATGEFTQTVSTRERPSDQQQTIRAITRESIGTIFHRADVQITTATGNTLTVKSPRVSQSAKDTWDKIIETVFLALLATTFGVFIAVPLSFLAARNLMKDIKIPLVKLALQLIAIPVGAAIGILLAQWAQDFSTVFTGHALLVVLGLVVLPALVYLALRWSFPAVEEEPPTLGLRISRSIVLTVASVVGITVLFLTADLLSRVGNWLAPRLADFAFIGGFASTIGDILAAIITLITALLAAGLLSNMGGRLAIWLQGHLPNRVLRPLALPLMALAGAVIFLLIAQAISWLYRINDPLKIFWVPGAVGAAFGLLLAWHNYKQEVVNIGLTIYYLARTTFNGIRSIEPLVVVIVFVVWVGIGPFAGSLALALHTVASLAKLYSEQVESILPGPLEAVQATGATRLQTVVYAVIPQIVPPYISFTLYRWDINVRMSTIIGFAGGGGIGFLLQQNIRLLNYQAASVNMLAIAIVVASMDYLSSKVRERIV